MARLRGNISDSATTLQVDDTTSLLVNGGVVQIESEKIRYTFATDKALLGCSRAYDGSSAATHADGKLVTNLSPLAEFLLPVELQGTADPTDNLDGVGFALTGSRFTNTTTGAVFINTGDSDEPTWEQLESGAPVVAWGDITGTLADQTDLQTALDAKLNLSGGMTTLGTTGTITPVATVGPNFSITVSGDVTLNGPSSPSNGQKVMFRIINDGSHSVTLATGSGNFRFGTDITAYTNTVSKTDYIGAVYNSTATRWDVVSVIQGF